MPRDTFRTRPVSRSRTTVMYLRFFLSLANTYSSSIPIRVTPLRSMVLYSASRTRFSASLTVRQSIPSFFATSEMEAVSRSVTMSHSKARVTRALGLVTNGSFSLKSLPHSGQRIRRTLTST